MKINILLAFLAVLCPSIVDAGELMKNWGLYHKERWASHINAPKAWKLAEGGRVVKVCVIDTGVDVNHPDLKGRICPAINGDEYGWDFIENRKNPVDVHGHGTHVAGIVRATTPTACIIPVKWFTEASSVSQRTKATAESIKYCVRRGAEIINYSGGGSSSDDERLAVEIARRKNVLFVAAAGNEYVPLGNGFEYYPASYRMPNIIAVAATTITGALVPSSDWGESTVQVAAPGEHVYSTLPGGRYGYLTGTSQAAPFVSGIAAMIISKYRLTPKQVSDIISESADKKSVLKGKVASGGKVNAYRAMLRAKDFYLRKPASTVR